MNNYETVLDLENGVVVVKAYANEIEDNLYGDICLNKEEILQQYPYSNILEGYCLFDTINQICTLESKDWYYSVEEAADDYLQLLIPDGYIVNLNAKSTDIFKLMKDKNSSNMSESTLTINLIVLENENMNGDNQFVTLTLFQEEGCSLYVDLPISVGKMFKLDDNINTLKKVFDIMKNIFEKEFLKETLSHEIREIGINALHDLAAEVKNPEIPVFIKHNGSLFKISHYFIADEKWIFKGENTKGASTLSLETIKSLIVKEALEENWSCSIYSAPYDELCKCELMVCVGNEDDWIKVEKIEVYPDFIDLITQDKNGIK